MPMASTNDVSNLPAFSLKLLNRSLSVSQQEHRQPLIQTKANTCSPTRTNTTLLANWPSSKERWPLTPVVSQTATGANTTCCYSSRWLPPCCVPKTCAKPGAITRLKIPTSAWCVLARGCRSASTPRNGQHSSVLNETVTT